MSQFNDLDEPDFDDADLDAVLAGADDAFEIDLSGAVEFSKLTDETGWFPAELTKVERHTSKTGNPCLKWFSKVAPGHAQAGAFLPIQTLNLSGRAAGRTKAMLRAIGRAKNGIGALRMRPITRVSSSGGIAEPSA